MVGLASKKSKSAKTNLKSVTVTMKDGASVLDEIDQLRGCIDCDVSIQDLPESRAKKVTIFPATIKSRGGQLRLSAKVADPVSISIPRKDVLKYGLIALFLWLKQPFFVNIKPISYQFLI